MPSPFPGMDPYLEEPNIWGDFHQSLATQIRRQIAPALEPRYIAALETKVTYDEVLISSGERLARPDLGIWDTGQGVAGSATAVLSAPLVVDVAVEAPVKLVSIEIRNVVYGTLVTVIEILSPVNKRADHAAAEEYQRKRRNLLRREVNVVEIDLLRAGQRTPPVRDPLPDVPYFVFVTRGSTARMEVWPIRLPDPLPTVLVPLQAPDPDLGLDLGLALTTIYDEARYRHRLNYSQAPPG